MKNGKTTAVSWHRSLVPDPKHVTRNPRVGWVLDLLQSIEDGQADELQTSRLGLRAKVRCSPTADDFAAGGFTGREAFEEGGPFFVALS